MQDATKPVTVAHLEAFAAELRKELSAFAERFDTRIAAAEDTLQREFHVVIEDLKHDVFGVAGDMHVMLKDHAKRLELIEHRLGLVA